MRHICKMEKLEIRGLIKYFCKEIHEDFFETLGKEDPSYMIVKKWAAGFKRGSVEDDGCSGHPKDATADENVKVVHTLVMCGRRRDQRSIASKVGISFRAVQSILTNILGMSKVSARCVPRMLTDHPPYSPDNGSF